ncbi:RHS repeat-associated core domain-containing protein [Archangium minus]|uniref:RHS repeat-associated core domain-containing protein n=1 Tax=Archangium minus TaxID=83450 RepID=A0ABY9WYG0_9BACT|nr:RHS repeat-associated core domain-containing protein [Archangium minus]
MSKGSLNVGDPINIASGHNLYRSEDFILQTSLGRLPFMRSYVSHNEAWTYGTLTTENVPLPFGSKESRDIPRWWHNFFSLVNVNGSSWRVVDRDGRQVEFGACSLPAGGSCFASQGSGHAAERDRLERTSTGFVYHVEGLERLVFDAEYKPSVGPSKYFLTRILEPGGAVLATLEYALPSGLTCRLGTNGATTGLPYLSTVTTVDGTQLVFQYKALQRGSTTVTDCVISEILLRQQGRPDELLVSYNYLTDGAVERSGRLRAIAWAAGNTETYDYTGENFVVLRDGQEAVRHNFATVSSAVRAVSSQVDGQTLTVQWQGGTSVPDPTNRLCKQYSLQPRWVTDTSAGRGDGTEGATPNFQRTYDTVAAYGSYHEPRLYRTTDNCAGSPQSCSPGSVRYEWPCATSSLPGHEKAIQDKRGNWEVNLYSPAPTGKPAQLIEKTAVLRGATDFNGTGAVERTDYGYVYGSQNTQLTSFEQQASVLAPSGTPDQARKLYLYEPATTPAPETDRKKATIRSGWTRVLRTTGWQTEKKYYGTFTFTSYVSANGTVKDPYGRVLEVHGPCEVTGETATDCGSTDYPLTRYEYWSADADVSVRNRLKSVSRFPSLALSPLVTTTLEYDAFGNPTVVLGEDGVITRFTYEQGKVSSVQVGSQLPTLYRYDGGKLTSIQYPEGNFEVLCFRKGDPASGCSGTRTEKLQWKAKASTLDGATWTERVLYTYWPDGTVKEERYQRWTGSGAETRRVLKFAADAHHRPTWQKWGEGAGSYTAASSFDGSDNSTGVGLPFNAPPAWCNVNPSTGSPQSELCSALTYDRADRLTSITEYPTANPGQGSMTLFEYDAQGNIAGVKSGCPVGATYAACTQPAATYAHDDFNRVVEASLPHAEGPTRYAYDAQDNTVVRETEAMRQAQEFVSMTYDQLSRRLYVHRMHSAGSELLYRFFYDGQGAAPPAGCPAVALAKGRMSSREDSFGRTWFQYNEQGQVVGEVRVRAGATTCGTEANANPHTFYTYTGNGNLASVTYPNGRTVRYVYGTGGDVDRVQAIDVMLYDVTAWISKRLLSNITWEPYAGLRGYTVHSPTSNTTRTVEYALGDDGSQPPVGCAVAFPSAASSDLTGRLRSLRVSSGSVPLGTGSGDIYKRTYTWTADQVVRTDTCLLGSSDPRTETYGYDKTLRLTGAQWSASGVASGNQALSYDGRGNHTSMNINGTAYTQGYEASPRGDRLTEWRSTAPGSLLGYSLGYDVDGRVIRKEGARELAGLPTYRLGFVYGQSVGVATETVFRAVEVNGVFYNYYYDALGRRRLKSYPGGSSDEYFHDLSNQMLVDRGSSSIRTPVAHHTQDDYVWLDGRPVVMVRGKLNTTWGRLSDASADCSRNGEASACGVFFPVTDHIGKPVLLLDGAGLVAGAVDHEPFGQANRVSLGVETEHPLQSMGKAYTLANLRQPASASTQVKMRVLFHLVDTQGVGNVRLFDGTTGTALSESIDGSGQGYFWSNWVQTSAGHAQVRFTYTQSCPVICNDLFCYEDCTSQSLTKIQANTAADTASGVVLEAYEYQRYQTGAQPFWIPLRFPGQYHDAETDLFENWNRYYDPRLGRYLQSEPLASWDPLMSRYPSYGYASNNPLRFADSTGLFIDATTNCPNFEKALVRAWFKAGCDLSSAEKSKCACQKAFSDCGYCDVCDMLRPLSGPIAREYEFKGGDKDLHAVTCGPMEGCRGESSMSQWQVFFNKKYCTDENYVGFFTDMMIHEAAHACSMVPGKKGAPPDPQGTDAAKLECSGYEMAKKCR